MVALDIFDLVEVGDGAGDTEDFVVSAGDTRPFYPFFYPFASQLFSDWETSDMVW